MCFQRFDFIGRFLFGYCFIVFHQTVSAVEDSVSFTFLKHLSLSLSIWRCYKFIQNRSLMRMSTFCFISKILVTVVLFCFCTFRFCWCIWTGILQWMSFRFCFFTDGDIVFYKTELNTFVAFQFPDFYVDVTMTTSTVRCCYYFSNNFINQGRFCVYFLKIFNQRQDVCRQFVSVSFCKYLNFQHRMCEPHKDYEYGKTGIVFDSL